MNNKESLRVLAYLKKINYASEKTPEQRRIRYIKRRTRKIYPLDLHFCEICGAKATEHHHYSNPIEVDKFNFVCHECHIKIHTSKKGDIKIHTSKKEV